MANGNGPSGLLERALRAAQSIQPHQIGGEIPTQGLEATRKRDDATRFRERVEQEQRRLRADIAQEQQRLRQRMVYERQFREMISEPFARAEIALTFDFHLAVGPFAYVDLEFEDQPIRYSIWMLPEAGWLRMQGRTLSQIYPPSDAALALAPQRLLQTIASNYQQWRKSR